MWNSELLKSTPMEGGLQDKVKQNINVAFYVYVVASLPVGATKSRTSDNYNPFTYNLAIGASSHGNPLDDYPSLGRQHQMWNNRVNLTQWEVITSLFQIH